MGALCVVTAVTLRVEPAFLLHADERPMRLDAVLESMDQMVGENDHFEFFWFPHTTDTLTRRNNRHDGPARPLPRWKAWRDDELVSNGLFEVTNRLGRRMPATIPQVNRLAVRIGGSRVYVDKSHKVFCSPRRVRFVEQEYGVPRPEIVAVLTEMRALFSQRDWRISFPVQVRFGPPDDAWLSTGYGRENAYVAVHVYRGTPYQDYFREIEAIMTAVGGRPHWGKLHTRDAAYLRSVYPRFDDFLRQRDRLDPERRFGNPYLSRVLGG